MQKFEFLSGSGFEKKAMKCIFYKMYMEGKFL